MPATTLPPELHRPHLPHARVALALAPLSIALIAVVAVALGAGAEGGDEFFSNVPLALALLAAGASGVAAGVFAVLALREQPPSSRVGRLAIIAPFVPLPLFALGALLVAIGMDEMYALGPAQTVWFLATFFAVVGGIGARLAGDRRAILALPLTYGLVVAIWIAAELIGHE